jgi:hypothetical protein
VQACDLNQQAVKPVLPMFRQPFHSREAFFREINEESEKYLDWFIGEFARSTQRVIELTSQESHEMAPQSEPATH